MRCSLDLQVFLITSILICSGLSSDVKVSGGTFHENQPETVTCTIDYAKLTLEKCSATFATVDKLSIEITKDGTTIVLCDFDSFKLCDLFNTSPLALRCGCYNDGQNIYTVNVTVMANKSNHENAWFDCKPNCYDALLNYRLNNSYEKMPITFEPDPQSGNNNSCGSGCIGGATAGAVCGVAGIAAGTYALVKKNKSSQHDEEETRTDEKKRKDVGEVHR